MFPFSHRQRLLGAEEDSRWKSGGHAQLELSEGETEADEYFPAALIVVPTEEELPDHTQARVPA